MPARRQQGFLASLLLVSLLASALAPCVTRLGGICACGKSKRSCCCKLLAGLGSFCVKTAGGKSCGISGTDAAASEPLDLGPAARRRPRARRHDRRLRGA